ncbi:MAG: glycosyltransferase family 4 protein [Vicinamibacterales bacterium]
MFEPEGRCGSLRVAVIARSVYPVHGVGGLERHVHDLVRHLLARGARVTLVTRRPASSRTAKGILHPRLETVFLPYRTFPFAGRRGTTVLDRSTAYLVFGYRAGRVAATLSSRGEVDVVHGLGAASLGYALAKRREQGAPAAPFVFNPQGLEEFGATDATYAGSRAKRLAYLPLRRAVVTCARAADCVIATDRSLKSVVERHLAPSPDRVRIVPNAIDLDEIDACGDGDELPGRLLERHGIGREEPVVLSVGRLERNKGFHVLAAALGRIAGQPWRWVLAGDGPMRRTIERAVDAQAIRRRVVFTGRVSEEDLHGWYRAATLFVHPTLYEGSSLVTLEAMAHRLAVVGTSAGGLPDKIEPGVTGWLVPPGKDGELASAIEEALSDRPRLDRMGIAGRAAVERAFSWPVVADMLFKVYQELVRA